MNLSYRYFPEHGKRLRSIIFDHLYTVGWFAAVQLWSRVMGTPNTARGLTSCAHAYLKYLRLFITLPRTYWFILNCHKSIIDVENEARRFGQDDSRAPESEGRGLQIFEASDSERQSPRSWTQALTLRGVIPGPWSVVKDSSRSHDVCEVRMVQDTIMSDYRSLYNCRLIERLITKEVMVVNHTNSLRTDRRQKRYCEYGHWRKQMGRYSVPVVVLK